MLTTKIRELERKLVAKSREKDKYDIENVTIETLDRMIGELATDSETTNTKLQHNDKFDDETNIAIKNKSTCLDAESSTKHESKEELDSIDIMSHQVTSILAC